MRGFFITIEGVEGAGKTSLAQLIGEAIAADGGEVVITSEPGGDYVAREIRKLLLESASTISDRAELLLFEAARAQHVDTLIRPALQRGATVICDRFGDSSLAYQGCARGIGIDAVRELNDYATGGLKPDITILLDVSASTGLERTLRHDRLTAEGIAFHLAVREGFLKVADAEPDRFVVIDASQDQNEVLCQALAAIRERRKTSLRRTK